MVENNVLSFKGKNTGQQVNLFTEFTQNGVLGYWPF